METSVGHEYCVKGGVGSGLVAHNASGCLDYGVKGGLRDVFVEEDAAVKSVGLRFGLGFWGIESGGGVIAFSTWNNAHFNY